LSVIHDKGGIVEVRKGSIRKRGDKYQITVDVGVDPATGKRKRRYGSFKTESEAKAAVDEIVTQVERGTYVHETDKLITEFLAEWLEATKSQLRPTTEYVYRRYLKLLHPFLPPIKAKDLKPKQAEELLAKLGEQYKPGTVSVCKRLLSTAFNRGVSWEIIAKNPFKGVRIRQEKPTYTVWTADQINAFLDAVRYKCEHHNGNWSYYTAFMIAVHTGMRKSEILALRWSNVDIDGRQIYVRESIHELYGQHRKHVDDTKSKAGNRAIWIDDDLADELNAQLARQRKKDEQMPAPPNDYIITTAQFRPIHPRNLTQMMFRTIEAEKLPRIRFHDLRHTHASLLLSTGISPKVIQDRLGHARIETTLNIYSHSLPSMQKDAADKIGALLKQPSAER
jgi:integrase